MKKYIVFKKGTTRSVALIYPLKIALKFPQFDFLKGLTIIRKIAKAFFIVYVKGDKKKEGLFLYDLSYRLGGHYERTVPPSLAYYWVRGIMANLNEMFYYTSDPDNPLLIPTYFSLFGLFNIQPIIEPIENHSIGLLHSKFDKLTDLKFEMDSHDTHAWEDGNFTKRKDGTIALYDYGSSRAFPMVKKYGHIFSRVLLEN